MSDLELCCNIVSCRQRLSNSGKAVVTTCSHIFCVSCANSTFSRALVCPACETSLTAPDDIVFQDLNPSQDYKSSCLAASRAISFFSYQIGQEQCFQEIMYKNVADKATGLETQIDEVIRDANQEIKGLRERYQAIQKEQEMDKRKSHDVYEGLQEKNRQFNKLQTLYDKMKAKNQREIAKVKLSEGVAARPVTHHQQAHHREQQPIHFPAPQIRRSATPNFQENAARLDTQRFVDTPREPRFVGSDGDQRGIPVMKQKSCRSVGYQGAAHQSFTASTRRSPTLQANNHRISRQHPPSTSGQALFAPRKAFFHRD